LVGGKERGGAGSYREREVPTEGHLGQEKVHGIAGFEAEGAKDFLCGLEVGAVDPGPKKRGSFHDTNMLKKD
jgi:hypothetical protein